MFTCFSVCGQWLASATWSWLPHWWPEVPSYLESYWFCGNAPGQRERRRKAPRTPTNFGRHWRRKSLSYISRTRGRSSHCAIVPTCPETIDAEPLSSHCRRCRKCEGFMSMSSADVASWLWYTVLQDICRLPSTRVGRSGLQ